MSERMPSPPYPDPLSPVLAVVIDRALPAYERGEATFGDALLCAAVHGWYEAASRARTDVQAVITGARSRRAWGVSGASPG